jgi:NADPH-dependent glutamate synthase beta subunit-like oxidoreductase
VTILYRRTQDEMPAISEEIEAAQQEGIEIRTLVTPVELLCDDGHLSGLVCLKNSLGEADSSGRRRPVPIPGTERHFKLDTLIVAIGEDSGIDAVTPAKQSGIEVTGRDTVSVDPSTLQTNRPGIFAAGDVVTGPNTVVDAIAAGKRAALVIDRYVRKEPLVQQAEARLPRTYVEPVATDKREISPTRIETPRAPADWRKRNFSEVEVALSVNEATREARRCLRCDLEFVQRDLPQPVTEETETVAGGKHV